MIHNTSQLQHKKTFIQEGKMVLYTVKEDSKTGSNNKIMLTSTITNTHTSKCF